jgi:acyl-coenzyme A synthetase/AMP-(fatty) acid ligase
VEEYQNNAQRVLRYAREHGDHTAIIIPVRDLTYEHLEQLILNYAQHLSRRGVGRDSIVAIDVENVVVKCALTLACALVGAPWVEATPPVLRDRKVPFTHLCFGVDKRHAENMNQFKIDGSWSKPLSGAPANLAPGGPDDVWTYAQSSGTTGTPKFMAVTHSRNEEGFERGFSVREGERPVAAWLSPSGTARLTPMIRVLAQGGCIVGAVDFNLFLRAGVNRLSGSPVQYANLLEGLRRPEKKLYLAQVTGAAAAETLLVRMLDFFERVLIRYGATEIGIVAERVVDHVPVDPSNVGAILPSATVELVDEEDRPVSAGEEGIVRIKRPDRQLQGYMNAEEISRKVFREGWFYPGDLGRFSEAGELHIVGRRDDRLNLGGVKVDAGRVDALIQNAPGVRDGYCFEDRDESGMSYLAFLLLLEENAAPDLVVQEIIRAMNASGLFYRVHRAYAATEIPRTTTGKPVRRMVPEFIRKQKPFTIKLRNPVKT